MFKLVGEQVKVMLCHLSLHLTLGIVLLIRFCVIFQKKKKNECNDHHMQSVLKPQDDNQSYVVSFSILISIV
jgi:hypothetical protein